MPELTCAHLPKSPLPTPTSLGDKFALITTSAPSFLMGSGALANSRADSGGRNT